MLYLVLLLILAGALEYFTCERTHRREIAYLRTHHQAMPPRPPRPLLQRIAPRAVAAMLVFGAALYLLLGPTQSSGGTLRALGAALLPIVVILGMMVIREASDRSSKTGRVSP